MLDSHPNIAAGPETPWLCAHQPRSLGGLVDYLCNDKHGFVASYGGSRAEVFAAARAFVDSLLTAYATRRGKLRWAEKTPENLLHLPFLTELFPEAGFIHLSRDALDVALSTSVVAPHRKGISEALERRLKLAPGLPLDNTVFNAALRCAHWQRKIEVGLSGRRVLKVSYEELVGTPEPTMRRLLEFVGEPFDTAVLDYARSAHDQPGWEWGSADVAHLAKTAGGITPARVGRAERELSALDRELLAPITGRPARLPFRALAHLADTGELLSERFTRVAAWIDGLAAPLGLSTTAGGADAWAYPWLWLNALSGVHWPASRLIDLQSGPSPLPWLAALLGGRVTLVSPNSQWVPLWQRLRTALGVHLDWKIADAGALQLPEACADVVTDLSRAWKPSSISAAARVLRPGAILALSFGSATASLPEDTPAPTFRDFEDQVWLHPAFGRRERPAWNCSARTDQRPSGAAILTKA